MLSRLEKLVGLTLLSLLPPQKLYASLLDVGYGRESITFKMVRYYYTDYK